MPLLICPACNVEMNQVQRSGIEIDICPQCRGVWLDRGELHKLLNPIRNDAHEIPRDDFYRRNNHFHDYDERG
ncbi:hypothetical protein FHS83_003635 [Rhizomicrobium palustre]|uniref:Transcription factor zinc-finger domain-containing protein n=1 Tax=Rhizomicrobium palustre TaxID=189966 RepID=A0A846N5J6_9PROT|nr:zf-TFIIB domain-containing protein [Rhizomicrobium palustre]NIK90317.1 hypothetical protein [Rhizomicrobium palustre]